jgi:hypothetical protein
VEHDLSGKPVSTFPDHALDRHLGPIADGPESRNSDQCKECCA